MSQAIIDTAVLTEVADAIRDKTGEPAPIKLGEMAQAIESIQGGGGGDSEKLKALIERNTTELTADYLAGATKIGGYAFYHYNGLTSVTIPDSVVTINTYAFQGCSSLTSVTIPDSVVTINTYAFSGCTSLQNVTVGAGIQTLGSSVLNCGSSSKKVTYVFRRTSPPSINSSSLAAAANIEAIYVPASSVNSYKSATNWATYASKIFAIPE